MGYVLWNVVGQFVGRGSRFIIPVPAPYHSGGVQALVSLRITLIGHENAIISGQVG